jgi:hypothetical protein
MPDGGNATHLLSRLGRVGAQTHGHVGEVRQFAQVGARHAEPRGVHAVPFLQGQRVHRAARDLHGELHSGGRPVLAVGSQASRASTGLWAGLAVGIRATPHCQQPPHSCPHGTRDRRHGAGEIRSQRRLLQGFQYGVAGGATEDCVIVHGCAKSATHTHTHIGTTHGHGTGETKILDGRNSPPKKPLRVVPRAAKKQGHLVLTTKDYGVQLGAFSGNNIPDR